MNSKEYVFAIWDLTKPQTFRQAKKMVDVDGRGLTEGTLRVYYSAWKRSHGIQRRYRKAAPAAEVGEEG